MNDYEQTWKEFWGPICADECDPLMDQIKRELHDYKQLLDNLPTLYDTITFGKFSKPNTAPKYIIEAVEDRMSLAYDDGFTAGREYGWDAGVEWTKSSETHDQYLQIFQTHIGRPKAGQPWGFGNPFVIGKDGDRGNVINKMKGWLDTGETYGNVDATPERRQWILDNLHTFKEKTIVLLEDCHGRTLLERAEKS